MAIPMAMLTYLRTALAGIPATFASPPNLGSCRIGLEANMTPADYPMIRIVPIRLGRATAVRVSELVREVECLVYFGVPIQEFEAGAVEAGIENLYERIFAMEADIIAALPTTGAYLVRYVETITDEDRVDAYKLMAMRVVVMGLT